MEIRVTQAQRANHMIFLPSFIDLKTVPCYKPNAKFAKK